MPFGKILGSTTLANYGRAIRDAPREVVTNKHLLFSALVYAMGAVPATWDQGSASVMPSLPGFQQQFDIDSGSDAKAIKNFVSIVYIGYAWGAALSFFINDRIGRLWSYRLSVAIWMIGQLVGTFTPTVAGLYASRIITGWGIGALTVTCPISIVEIAPREIRGMLTAWFNVVMGLALTSSVFCVYGVFAHVASSRLQYQIVFFSPCVWMSLCVFASFWVTESPRWLFLTQTRDKAVETVMKLRGLPTDHPRIREELQDMEDSADLQRHTVHTLGFGGIVKETFLIPANLRRVQQTLVSYALAQLSGANSITSYLVPILALLGVGGGILKSLFFAGMYGMSKFFFTLIASFLIIDTLGRRKSLFLGCSLQMVSDLYVGIYLKYRQNGQYNDSSSEAALALIFIHAFGYIVGLFTLPYVFGGEVWPDHLRSFGAALSSTFHWLFIYAMAYGTPSLLEATDHWGAFIFFAAWCFVAIVYVYFAVPETSGLTVMEITKVFEGPWFNARKRVKELNMEESSNDLDVEGSQKVEGAFGKSVN